MTKKSQAGGFARPGSDFARPNLTNPHTNTPFANSLRANLKTLRVKFPRANKAIRPRAASPKIPHVALPSKPHAIPLLGAVTAVCISLCMLATPNPTHAASLSNFRPGDIMSDAVMSNYNSMSEASIQTFLKSKNSCNDTRTHLVSNKRNYVVETGTTYSWHVENGHFVCLADETFSGGTAAHIIWQAAQDYRINPQVLIVTLQKEQGLITDTAPNSIQYRSAMGFGCPDTAACNSKYYGFRNQIRLAASFFRSVLDGGWSNYPAYTTQYVRYSPNASCGGSNIYIANRATSALYRYTPYQPNASALAAGYGTGDSCGSYGNRNFWLYFTDWFGDTHGSTTKTRTALRNLYIPEDDYYLFTTGGKALDVSGAGKSSGTNVQIWDINYGSAQKFHISANTDGSYKIVNVASGKALDVNGASKASGTNVQIWDKNTSCAQKWAISEVGNGGTYAFRNLCSGKALDINGGQISTNGANVQVWDYHGGTAQQWRLIANSLDPITNAKYSLIDFKGKALDVSGGFTSDGTNAQIWDNHDGNSEEFLFNRRADGFYNIINTRSGKALDVDGASLNSGANVQIWTRNDSCAQKWAAVKASDGSYIFVNACAGRALDVNGGYTDTSGTNVQVWTLHGGESQKWQLAEPNQSYLTSGTYQILTTAGKALRTPGEIAGVSVEIYTRSTFTGTQKYRFYRTSDGYFRIRNLFSNKYLDVAGASSASGANVQVWTANNSCAQKWFITKNSGSYSINNACGGHALDVNNGAINTIRTNVQVWSRNTSVAQRWRIAKL